MNREQQARRKVRERKKTFIGIVSSLKNDMPLTREMINGILVHADTLGLRMIVHIAVEALDCIDAKKRALRAEANEQACQTEMSDLQARIVSLEQQLHGKNVARIRNMSKKAQAYRPEKKRYSSAKYHPMSGYRNRSNRRAG